MQLSVKVKPSSKHQTIEEMPDGSLTIRLKSPPIDGKANAELIDLLAEKYGVKKAQVHIKSGISSKLKRIEIEV